jgi:hypothetical protein
MSEAFWEKFPKESVVRCLEMKDRAQARIASETRELSPESLVEYFRNAARLFRLESADIYRKSASSTMAVCEPDEDPKET